MKAARQGHILGVNEWPRPRRLNPLAARHQTFMTRKCMSSHHLRLESASGPSKALGWAHDLKNGWCPYHVWRHRGLELPSRTRI